MHGHPAAETFINSLATPGSGTLKKNKRFSDPAYKGRLFAKTGYISKAWALSGYCKTPDNHWLAFSLIANNGNTSPRSLLDRIVKCFLDDPKQ